MQKNAF